QAYKSFVFTPVCPENLKLTAVTTALPEYTAVNTAGVVTVSGAAATALTASGTVIATLTFTVQPTAVTGDVSLSAKSIALDKKTVANAPAVSVALHNIKVSFAQGTDSTMTAKTAYAKYNSAGLYADNAYQTPFTFPLPVASAGYRLATPKLWGKDAAAFTQAEVSAQKFTADAAFTAQT
ncbi:MAG: hypothetical protein RSB55_06515, partial [Oscillospiraceae bacterium]